MEETTPRPKLRPRQRTRRISVFDGQDLKKAILAGAAWLEVNRETINALNVFPVPDGDTGSNMAATMKSAIRNIAESEEKSAAAIAKKVAHDALLGARGNSGVILSQTLRGVAIGLEGKDTFNAQDLANAFQEASQLAYRAVIKPVEGTILTVVREVAEAALKSAEHQNDLVTEMQDVVAAAHKAVAQTPELLPILKQAGVVDAGGQGFCTILEGILRYMRGDATDQSNNTDGSSTFNTEAHTKKGVVSVEEEFGYEVVFLLRGTNLDVEDIRQTIIDMGGVSTVVAGDETMLKVHTHTLTPGQILDYGVSLGSLLDINIENLQEQSLSYEAASKAEHAEEVAHEAEAEAEALHSNLATVAVVAGTGFEKVFRGLGVNSIVSGGQTMNPSIEQLLAAVEKIPTQQIIILPNNSNVILSAQQVVGLSSKEVFVVPCKTLPQGIAAMISINHEADFTINCEAMTEAARTIQTIEITTAVRSVQLGTLHVREGDCIGVINGNLSVATASIEDTIRDTLQRINIDTYEIVTIFYGEDVTEEQAQETARRIKTTHSGLEIEVVNGGQPYYAYIISAE
ncbi:DAK2 domain-containing protein [Dictyobacter arantiisoli]|uniref:Dihydroxyacetone kinase n=1 Tax=Dictyobacter arantiisoli TaxID=2014874 RepID=A0A5A5TK22_9CHLR|nr:DAK2 domain-containing protein [Dictyobacter arantiisoli]GCF11373.1 dihydroxyacetone kinase [Dictyobacter arantiisoli]